MNSLCPGFDSDYSLRFKLFSFCSFTRFSWWLIKSRLTSDGKLSGGVSQRNELLLAAVVIDDDVHGVGAQWDVIRTNGQGGGRAI